VARHYLRGLQGLQLSGLVLPNETSADTSAWHLFVIRHPQRDRLAAELAKAGIGTVIHYPVAPHLQPAYAALGLGAGSLPFSERLHAEVLSLPIGPTQTVDQTEDVVRAVRQALMALQPAQAAAA